MVLKGLTYEQRLPKFTTPVSGSLTARIPIHSLQNIWFFIDKKHFGLIKDQ